jgi:RNA polymerase sigma factor (sigma-70 family)
LPYPDARVARFTSIVATAAPEIPALARDQAFESLYRRYVKDVYHYALALLRNPADAEDVTQTTFLNAYRAYQRGIEVEKPQNWLIKIAHNVARTRYARASRRVKEVPLEDHVEQLALPEADRPDVTGVLRALGRLPFNQRAALVMRELEGRSYAEIADTIGVSVSAVETLIFRGRKSLRLKASALRVLAAVPLPSSLTQLFGGGGGVVAGGGAAVGTGFLVKAAVAVVAGVVATGVSSDRQGPTATAAGSTPRLATAQSSLRAGGSTARPSSLARRAKGARPGIQGRVPGRSARIGIGIKNPDGITAPGAAGRQAPHGTGLATAATSCATPALPLPSPVSNLADTVETAVAAVPTAPPIQVPSLPPVQVPSLPHVPVPSLPPAPVEVPKVPGIPLP